MSEQREKLLKIFENWGLQQYIPHYTERAMLADYLLANLLPDEIEQTMKCPYRIIQTVNASGVLPTISQDFAECYGEECPHYRPERKIGNLTALAYCSKSLVDEINAKKEK